MSVYFILFEVFIERGPNLSTDFYQYTYFWTQGPFVEF